MKKMKKLLAVLTAGVMCAGMTAGAYVTAQEFPAVSDAAESTVMVQDDGETKVEGDFSYRVQEDGMIEILKYVGETTVTNLAVPGKIGDIPVTRLGSMALYGLTNLEGVSLPDSLTSIGQGAFWKTKLWATQESVVGSTKAIYAGHWAIGYYNGENVSIAEGTVGIADYAGTEEYIAFSGKKSILSGGDLTNISLPNSLKYIGENAFYKQSNLKVIDVPDSVVKIGARAFLGTEIATINIPDGVTSIEDDTFYDCSSLSDIKLPSSITHIGKRAFAETKCVDDQETNEKYVGNWLVEGAENDVKLKEGTIGISDNAFNETSSHYNDPTYVTSIMMVSSLKYIGNEAFKDCNSLTEITFPTSWVGVSVNTEWFQDRLEAFNEEYGDSIKVNVEEIAGDQNYVDKLKVLYSSNSLPDTFSTGGYNLIDSMKDQLVDLTDYVDDDWKKLATDACWDVNSRDGKIYGIPWNEGIILIFMEFLIPDR